MANSTEGGKGYAGFGKFDLAVFAAFVVNALIFLWAYRFVPLQDFPDWVYQGLLFHKALTGQLLKDFFLFPYPVPNAISTVLMGLFNFVLSPEASGKLMFSIDILLFAAGSVYLLCASDAKRNSFLYYLPLLLIFNFFFFLGYVNYYFSLGVLFFALGYIIRRQDEPGRIRFGAVLLFSVLLFFSHAMSYATFLLYLALLLVARWDGKAAAKSFAAALPSLVLAFLYAWHHLHESKLGLSRPGTILSFLPPDFENAIQYFSILHRFYPFTDMYDPLIRTFNAANQAFCLLVFALYAYGFFYCVINYQKHWVLSVMILLSTLGFLFLPFYFVGIVKPGERFIYPALWLILECLIPHFSRFGTRANMAGKAVLLAFFAVQLVFLYGHAGVVARRSTGLYEDIRKNTVPGEIGLIYESHFSFQGTFTNQFTGSRAFMPSYAPVMRLPYYLDVERYLYTPIFITGIFGNRHFVPANDSIYAVTRMIDYFPAQIVIMGAHPGSDLIYDLLKDRYRKRFENEHLVIVERRSG